MFEEYYRLVGTNVIYFLLVEPGVYKFGITYDIYVRLQTHKRKLNFIEVVRVFPCVSRNSSFRVEQKFKKYAAEIGILIRKYNQTEIIVTDEPQKYVDWFDREVKIDGENLGMLAIVDDIDTSAKLPKLRLPGYNKNIEKFIMKMGKFRPKINKKLVVKNNTAVLKIEDVKFQPKVIMRQVLKKDVFTCDKCGKKFKLEHHLKQHNARKTPCIKPQNIIGKFKCIYCNRDYSRQPNLTKHQKLCKMKHGGVEKIPDPNVRLEEQIRILKEEREKEKEEQKREMAELREMIRLYKERKYDKELADIIAEL